MIREFDACPRLQLNSVDGILNIRLLDFCLLNYCTPQTVVHSTTTDDDNNNWQDYMKT